MAYEDDIDFVSRYASRLAPSAPGGGTWQEREQHISNEIAAGPDATAAGFAWNFDDIYTKNISSLIASGDMAHAKRYYDDVRGAIEANRDLLLSMSQVSDTGSIADELAKRSTDILMGKYNQAQVQLSDGSIVTVGQVLADGSPFMENRAEELTRLGFTSKAQDLYLSNDRNIKTIMDPFLRGARVGGRDTPGVDGMPNRIQMRDLAEAYANDSERINSIFEDGSARFLDHVRETHKTSGNAAATLRTLTDFADAYSQATGVTGTELASQVVNGYNDLVSTVFRGTTVDKNGKPVPPAPVTDEQRRTFDAAFLPAVKEAMARTGGAFDLHDPRLRSSMLEIMDTLAYASSVRNDVFNAARGAGAGLNKMFGDYVAEAMTGQTHQPNNIVTGIRHVREQLSRRLTGGRDFADMVSTLTGQATDYLSNVDKINGTKSTNLEADGVAAEAHSFLAQHMIGSLASGASPATAFDAVAGSADARSELATRLSRSFYGRGRDELATFVANGIIDGLAAGERVNVEELISELCFGKGQQALSADALKTARTWYHGNVASQLAFAEQKTALRLKYLSEGYNDAQARRAVAMISEQASREAANGGNPLTVFETADDVGVYFTRQPMVDAKGKPLKDANGNTMLRTVKLTGMRSKVPVYINEETMLPPGTFRNDPAGWDSIMSSLRESYARETELQTFRQKKVIAEEMKMDSL